MKNIVSKIAIGCCVVFFWAASVYAQSYDTCAHLRAWEARDPQPGDYKMAKEQYDTLRLYIEKCAASDDQSYWAFSSLDGADQLLSNDTTRFEKYRAWLITVLYLNKTNPAYFCNCLSSIGGTYQFGKFHPLGYLAVLSYLRQNHPCGWGTADSVEYAKDSTYDAKNGYDPTHLPSLDSMGLGFLLHPSIVLSPSFPLSSQYLASFTSSPNPFIGETKLRFVLNRTSYVTIEVYDLLGNKVYVADPPGRSNGTGQSYEAGGHEIVLDGRTLPHGTLYARISTGFGEVKTVKLVHE